MSTEHTALGKLHALVIAWVFGVVGTFHGLGIALKVLKEETPEGLRQLVQNNQLVAALLAAFVLGLIVGFVSHKIGPKLLRLLRVRKILTKLLNKLPDEKTQEGSPAAENDGIPERKEL